MHMCAHSHIAEIRKVAATRVDVCVLVTGSVCVVGEASACKRQAEAGVQVKLQIASG